MEGQPNDAGQNDAGEWGAIEQPEETPVVPEQDELKEIPEGYVLATLFDGRQEIVPACPEDEDPVDFYSAQGIPLRGLPGLPDYESHDGE